MKKRSIFLVVVMGAVLLLGGCLPQGKKAPDPAGAPSSMPVSASSLTYFYMSESSSYFKRVQGFEFRAENGANTAFFQMANEEEPYPVPVDEAWVKQLEEIVRENNMASWNGFSQSDSTLLDGTHFFVELIFSDGSCVSASGYGRFPAGYGEASEAINTLFMQLLPEEMRDW